MQPGQTVTPGGTQENPAWQFNPETQPQAPQPQPAPVASQPLPAPQPTPAATPVILPQPASPTPAVTAAVAPLVAPVPQATAEDTGGVTWTASEFIAHNKTGGWYGLLALGTAVLAAAVFLLTRDRISTGVIVIVAILFGFSASRKPRQLQYEVTSGGIIIGGKPYPYSNIRSFAIVQEGGIESIWFMPLKRFNPIVSIYFDPADGDKIVDILSQYLPVENRGLDPVDRLMHRIRF